MEYRRRHHSETESSGGSSYNPCARLHQALSCTTNASATARSVSLHFTSDTTSRQGSNDVSTSPSSYSILYAYARASNAASVPEKNASSSSQKTRTRRPTARRPVIANAAPTCPARASVAMTRTRTHVDDASAVEFSSLCPRGRVRDGAREASLSLRRHLAHAPHDATFRIDHSTARR